MHKQPREGRQVAFHVEAPAQWGCNDAILMPFTVNRA